jgi:diacylglycerol kinase
MANFMLMGIVIGLELANTAIETLCDVVHPDYSHQIKIVKDMAAGAVLMTALIWAIVIVYQALIIFVFKISNIGF